MGRNENLELNRILDILKSKKILIILILMIFIVLGYFYSYYCITPEYKSTSTLLLIPNSTEENKTITSSDLTLNSGLISTYSNIAKNSKVLKQVIDNLNLDMTEGELLNHIGISIVRDTHIMEISVTHSDAQMAMNITKELSNVFLQEIKDIYKLNNIGIVDEAQLTDNPYNINHIKDISIFFVIGIIVCIIYVIIVYIVDNTIKKEEDIERYIKVKTLGSIPIYSNKKKNEIVDRSNVKSYISECINTIRTNILYMNSTKNAKTILVTSCTPREGKSWVSANIAASFADTNKKVLLIDGDMRKGRANKIFGVDNKEGLSNYLYFITGNVQEDIELGKKYIRETKIPNLHILTNGIIPPNPSELLASSSMKELMTFLKNIYDVIIIDAPPCKLVSDSIVLSTIVDSTILVVNAEKTKINDLKQVKKSICIVGGKIIGTILNRAKVKEKTYGKSYYSIQNKTEQQYETKEKIYTVNEIIDQAIANLKEKDFNIFFEEELLANSQEEQYNYQLEDKSKDKLENNDNVDEFIKRQNNYLEKVVNTVSDIKVQINSNMMQDSIKNKRQEENIEDAITRKIEEWQQKNNIEIKEEIQKINNEDELNKISNQLEKVYTNYESILEKMNNTNDNGQLIEELQKNNLNEEQISGILKQELANSNYTDKIDKVFNEINEVKTNYNDLVQEIKQINNTDDIIEEIKQISRTDDIIQEIKQINRTDDIIEQINNKNITSEQIKEILKEEISNINYTNEIEKIYDEIKDAKADYQQLVTNIKDTTYAESLIESIYDRIDDTGTSYEHLIKEMIKTNNEKMEKMQEETQELLREQISNMNYAYNIEEIYEKIEDVRTNYRHLIKEIVNSNNEKIEEMQEETQKLLQEKIESINYTEQINQMNEMIANLKDSYLELSNIIRTNNKDKQEINHNNVIDLKSLKKRKENKQLPTKQREYRLYSLKEDIPYSELEKTAICVISLKPNDVNNFLSESYENMI